MKITKPLLALIIAVVAVVIVLALIIVTYNGLVNSEQQVESQWAQVENEYQRKIDLIPNLVNITSQYIQFEAATLANITALRMEWLSALTSEERLNTSIALDGEINTIVLAYFAAENYPTLSSIPLVANLMDEIAGTENRIAVERMYYNEEVQDLYNEMHPAVLYQIAYVIRVCKRYNVETSICGQAASNEEMAEFLVKAGIESISANIDSVKKIRKIVAKTEKKLLLGVARKGFKV